MIYSGFCRQNRSVFKNVPQLYQSNSVILNDRHLFMVLHKYLCNVILSLSFTRFVMMLYALFVVRAPLVSLSFAL